VLGADDQISIWALGAEETSDKPLRIDAAGFIDVPMVGRVKAGGLTLEQLKQELVVRLSSQIRHPQVSVSIVSFGSQPVSVIGAVNKPGVYQLQGPKTLLEVLSLAGGLNNDAGSTIRIIRRSRQGKGRQPDALNASAQGADVTELNLRSIVEGDKTSANLIIQPDDVIAVSRAKIVYVTGAVRKPGGFALGEREGVTVLQALSLAEGLNTTAAARDAKIFRGGKSGPSHSEISLDVQKMLDGRAHDIDLQPEDVLFIPDSKSKSAAIRAVEAAINIGTGVTIWRVGGVHP
jgi:polysaccharide export outer membrane protein